MNRSSSLMQAAVVLNSLPKKQAAQLLARLEPGDMKSVMEAITRLDDVSAEQISACLKKLADDAERWKGTQESDSSPEVAAAKKQLDNALSIVPKKPDWKTNQEQPFDFLLETIPVIRNHVLEDEHPRNVAIILSCFPPEVASQCMNGLEPNLRISVIKRLCELEEIEEEEISELGYALRMRLNKLLNSRAAKTIGMQTAAELLSCSNPSLQESLLTHVGQTDPDLAHKLQRSVIRIERLLTLESEEIKLVLKNVDTACWAPAIKNASPELIDLIMVNLADHPRQLLAQEINEIGAVTSEAEGEARKSIVQVVLKLAREGKIELQRTGPRQKAAALPLGNLPESTVYQIVP